jgi:hypothetical protein
MISLPPSLSVLPFACVDDAPWFLLVRPRGTWTDRWEPLRAEAFPNEPMPAAALRIASERRLPAVERVYDLGQARWERALAVRVEAPDTVFVDPEAYDDARWVPFEAASRLLDREEDKSSLRRLNRILDVMLRRVEVVFEEVRDEGG